MDERDLLKSVAAALRSVTHPRTGRDLITSGIVRNLTVTGPGQVSFRLLKDPGEPGDLAEVARAAAESVEGVEAATVQTVEGGSEGVGAGRKLPVMGQPVGGSQTSRSTRPPLGSPATPPEPEAIPGIRWVVAVSSGKGGVGKSTVSTNLAAALANEGHAVGLLDADVYGPNIPMMFGAYGRPQVTPEERVVPLEAHGVKLMSIGFLLDEDTPAIWRGPIVMGIIKQFLRQVDWGQLDYLLVDMPPGTGDAQLSLVQLVRVDGAVLVTTPQDVATADVLKAIKMFETVDVRVLGVIENMSGYECPHCGEHTDLFGRGGGRKLAATAGVPFLGEVPLAADVVGDGDRGRPTVVGAPDSPHAKAFTALAAGVAAALESADNPVEAPSP